MKGNLALRKPTQTAHVDMSSTNVTTVAWVTIIAALTWGVSAIEIFNPSGSTMLVATGSAGNEVAIPYTVLPGGSSIMLPVEIGNGKRISVKAVDQTANSGLFTINCFG